MLHEGLGCVALWRDFPAKLAAASGCGVFAYSRAGYGGSDPVALPCPLDYMSREARFSLPTVLNAIGLKRGISLERKSLFIWEGVSMYLEEEAVREILRTIASNAARGSSLVMDFAEQAMLDLLGKFSQLSQHNYTTKWGEPWIFGVPDNEEQNFFRECGLEVVEVLSCFGRDAAKRYLTRADGSRFGSVRGGPPSRRTFTTALRVIWTFLTRRSKWYALAALKVP